MELSIFLAKLIGLYMLVIAAIWILFKERVDRSMQEIVASKGLIPYAGAVSILVGLAIAIGHSIWQFSWIGLITLLGYLMIIQGIIRLVFAEEGQKYAVKVMEKGYWPIITGLIIIGLFLTYSGFTAAVGQHF